MKSNLTYASYNEITSYISTLGKITIILSKLYHSPPFYKRQPKSNNCTIKTAEGKYSVNVYVLESLSDIMKTDFWGILPSVLSLFFVQEIKFDVHVLFN